MASVSSSQLLGSVSTDDADDCDPLAYNGSLVLHPCGVIANSLFNDIYTVTSDHVMDETDIAWATDVKDKVGATICPTTSGCAGAGDFFVCELAAIITAATCGRMQHDGGLSVSGCQMDLRSSELLPRQAIALFFSIFCLRFSTVWYLPV